MNYNRVSATIGIRAVDPRTGDDNPVLKQMVHFRSNLQEQLSVMDAKLDHLLDMASNIQILVSKINKERGLVEDIVGANVCFQPQITTEFGEKNQLLFSPNSTKSSNNHPIATTVSDSVTSSNSIELMNKDTIQPEEKFEAESGTQQKSEIESGASPMVPEGAGRIVTVLSKETGNSIFELESSKNNVDKFGFGSELSKNNNAQEVFDGLTNWDLKPPEEVAAFVDSKKDIYAYMTKIMVGSLLLSLLLYNCRNGDGLITEELKWLDTGQYIFVSCFSRDGVVFDSIVSCNPVNEMYWNKNTLVSGMQLKDSWSEWGKIKIVVRGANNHEQNSGALRIQELVDCVSLYVMNFTCLAFAYDPGIYCMCWNESLVHFLKIQLDNSATTNHKIGLYSVKMVNNVSIFHKSLANPTVGLEDAMPLHEISSLHTVCCPTKHVTSREIRCKNRKKEMRWYLMAFNDHLHYSDVFFKPSKYQLLKCVMNDGPSWSVKVLNSSEEKAAEQRHVLEVLDDISPKQLGVKIKELENCGVWINI